MGIERVQCCTNYTKGLSLALSDTFVMCKDKIRMRTQTGKAGGKHTTFEILYTSLLLSPFSSKGNLEVRGTVKVHYNNLWGPPS